MSIHRLRMLVDFVRGIQVAEFYICSFFFILSVVYAVLHQVWASWPEWFRFAGIVDDVLGALALGYSAAYIFYLLTVHFPRKRQKKNMLLLVAKHLSVIKINVESFYDTMNYNILSNDEHDNDFIVDCIKKHNNNSGYFDKDIFHFYMQRYPFEAGTEEATIVDFIKMYSSEAFYSIYEVKQLLSEDLNFLREELDNAEKKCLSVRDGESEIDCCFMMSCLYHVVQRFVDECGAIGSLSEINSSRN
jgi:hypothetical protein